MASSLTLTTGALTSTLTTQNDTAAGNVLLNFAKAIGAQDAWTNQQKLDYVVSYLAGYMENAARERWFQAESATLREESITEVHW
jgi:hypothetical protein